MDYFYNVNIHDALHVLKKKKKRGESFLKGLPRRLTDAPTTLGGVGGDLTGDRYVPGSQNTEPALLQLIDMGVEERRKKEKNP